MSAFINPRILSFITLLLFSIYALFTMSIAEQSLLVFVSIGQLLYLVLRPTNDSVSDTEKGEV